MNRFAACKNGVTTLKMNNLHVMGSMIPLLLLFLAACQPQAFSPPRLATATLISEKATPESQEPLFLAAPTATADTIQRNEAELSSNEVLNVWVNETSPEHQAVLQSMMEDFTQQSGVNVAIRLVSPRLLPDLMHTAVLSDTLPDVVLHPLEYTVTWSEEGILDPQAATSIIDEIGRDSFDQAALDLASANGQPSAIPSDGFHQIWLYRTDWTKQQGLDIPDNYEGMMDNAEAFFDPENIISGIVIPTESNLITTHRAFEHLATANGCQMIDNKGEVHLLDNTCREALDFYFSIVNQFSPTGVQTDTSARNAFLEGRTAMIMTSPDILPDLAEAAPLDQNTGILTTLTGRGANSNPANFGNISFLGITTAADPDVASAFAKYWFGDGYANWLAVEPERKVPMYLGTNEDPGLFIDQWGQTPVIEGKSLADIFGEETVNLLKENVADTERWGFKQGQGALVGKLYESLTFSVVLQEMLSGYFDSTQTIQEAAERVIELIPNYQFAIEPTPMPVPTS